MISPSAASRCSLLFRYLWRAARNRFWQWSARVSTLFFHVHRQAKDVPDRGLTHVAPGDSAYLPRMVDAGKQKQPVLLTRVPWCNYCLTLYRPYPLSTDSVRIAGPKGAVFNTAIIAGVCGARRRGSDFCHPLNLEKCDLEVNLIKENGVADVVIDCRVSLIGRTGVEMEVLVGASVSGLCIYDMLGAVP